MGHIVIIYLGIKCSCAVNINNRGFSNINLVINNYDLWANGHIYTAFKYKDQQDNR